MGCSPQQGGGKGNFLSGPMPMLILLFAVFYFLLIRPQQQRQKKQKAMIASIQKGDKVVTAGGIHGLVTGVKDNTLVIKIADNVKVEVNRSSVSRVLTDSPAEIAKK
jgi:preprotein translocase subunit YajC